MADLKYVRYFDTQLRVTEKLIDHIVQTVPVWDQMPGYIRFGKLVCFGTLKRHLEHLKGGEEHGDLTRRQVRKLRNLERLAKKALGTIKVLKARHAELDEREKREAE